MAQFPTNYAIWSVMEHQGRTLSWLARRIDYSYAHVKGVHAGIQPASAAFRAACATALDLPESMLFQLQVEADATAVASREGA